MNLSEIQRQAWQIAEEKGHHDSFDQVVFFGPREQALAGSIWLYNLVTEIVQKIKKHGVPSEEELRTWKEKYDEVIEDWMANVLNPLEFQINVSALAVHARLALIGTEVSEASDIEGIVGKSGLMEELSDILIRVADLAESVGGNLDDAVMAKLKKNRLRPHLFGTPEEAK